MAAAKTDDEVLLPTRLQLLRGEPVTIEISFGPLADEILLTGSVLIPRSVPNHPSLRVKLDPAQTAKLAYVSAVLDGGRDAAARRHRRIPSSIAVAWGTDGFVHSSRLRDISAGGAFILSKTPPEIGKQIEVVLRPGAAMPKVSVSSVVSWVQTDGATMGFGVNFKPSDAVIAQQLSEVVRQHEPDSLLV